VELNTRNYHTFPSTIRGEINK